MKIHILSIADRGVAFQERLHLKVTEPTNLGSYLVVSSVWVNPTAVANGSRPMYWFPPQELKANDDVVLYTRGGAHLPAQPNTVGGTTYFYFWGQPNTLWNSPEACALLFDVASWIASPSLNPLNQQFWHQVYSGLPPQPQNNSFAGYGVAGQYGAGPGVIPGLSPNSSAPLTPDAFQALTKGWLSGDKDDDDANPFGRY